MRMKMLWPLVLLLAAGCSRDEGVPPADASGGAPRAAHDANRVETGFESGAGRGAVEEGAAGRTVNGGVGSGAQFARALPAGSAAGEANLRGGPDQGGTNAGTGRGALVPPPPAGAAQSSGEVEEATPAGAAIKSLGESFLRALGRTALHHAAQRARTPPPLEDDPFPQGEPPDKQPEEGGAP